MLFFLLEPLHSNTAWHFLQAGTVVQAKYICLTSVMRVKCGVHSTLCWKVGNISGST